MIGVNSVQVTLFWKILRGKLKVRKRESSQLCEGFSVEMEGDDQPEEEGTTTHTAVKKRRNELKSSIKREGICGTT
jgi:hypothetical protein